MPDLIVRLGNPESFETDCFGDGSRIEWERSYSVIGHDQSPGVPVEGKVSYIPEFNEDTARIDVDGCEPPDTLFSSRDEAYQAFIDDDQAASLILQTLAEVIELKKSRQAVALYRAKRSKI